MVTILSYGSKKDVLKNGYQPPENMSGRDKLCKSCLLEIKNNQTQGRKHNEKASIGSQIGILLLGIIIPFVWLYPFYKVGKLGYGLIISVGLTIVAFVPLIISFEFDLDSTVGAYFIILHFAKIPILFYFLIKWTRAWNKDAI